MRTRSHSPSSLLPPLSAGSDYSYFDRDKLDNWAGPEHWKFARPTRRRAAKQQQQQQREYDGTGVGVGSAASAKAADGRRGRRAGFTIDFAAPPVDPKTAFAPPPRARTATVLTEASRKKAASAGTSAHLLPEDLHYDVDSLLALASAPRAGVRKLRMALPGADAGDGVPTSDLLHPRPMLHEAPAPGEEGAPSRDGSFVSFGALRTYGELLAARRRGTASADGGPTSGAVGLCSSGLDATVCFNGQLGTAAPDDTFIGGLGGDCGDDDDFDDVDGAGDGGCLPPTTPGGTLRTSHLASHGVLHAPKPHTPPYSCRTL